MASSMAGQISEGSGAANFGKLRASGTGAARCRRLPRSAFSSEKLPRAFLVSIDQRVGAHIGQRLDGERRVEAGAHGWEGRAADDEQIRNVPALAVTVHDRILRIAAHPRSTLVMRARDALVQG